ncbi:efflux RND transporter periplasmic adaptor subunit [Frateuria aurantia]
MSRVLKIAVIVVIVVVLALLGMHFLRPAGGPHGGPHGRGHYGHRPAHGGSAEEPAADSGNGPGSDGGKPGSDPGSSEPVPVTVEPVRSQDVPVYLDNQGTVTALNSVTIQPQIAGPLYSLHFTEGQAVKKGELLALIDPRPYQATLDEDIAKTAQDEASLQTAISTFDRNKRLLSKGYVSALNMDTYTNNVAQLKATVAADKAAAQYARVQLSYTRILSPIDGIAGIRQVDPGNQLTTSSDIVVITQIKPIYVIFNLPEQTLDQVRAASAGSRLKVLALNADKTGVVASDGYLDVVDNQVTTTTGTYKLRAVFPNTKGELWPGQYTNARLQVRVIHDGLVIPSQAVQRGPDGDYVYLVQADKTVKMQPVTTGSEVGDSHVMISKGLQLNDLVVTEGQFRLKPGSKVNAMQPGQLPAAPTAEELKKAGASMRHGRGRGGPPGGGPP